MTAKENAIGKLNDAIAAIKKNDGVTAAWLVQGVMDTLRGSGDAGALLAEMGLRIDNSDFMRPRLVPDVPYMDMPSDHPPYGDPHYSDPCLGENIHFGSGSITEMEG